MAMIYEGDRVFLVHDVERFPHFIARKGLTGTVLEMSSDLIRVKMDKPLPGAEEWDNEVHWTEDEVRFFNDDCYPI